MTKTVKKPSYLHPFPRLFTRAEGEAYDAIVFQSSESFGDEAAPALASPVTWNTEAVAVMAEAACKAVPADLRAVEENTVPSWLWRHQSKGTRRAAESDLRDIFDRVVGSASASAWKLGLFTSEKHARAFSDELRFALMQRHVAIAPDVMAGWGLAWAYGGNEESQRKASVAKEMATLSNAAIDGLMGRGNEAASSALWHKLFALRGHDMTTVGLRFSDTSADWHSAGAAPARAAIDLMALRHNDGSVNIDALKQAARMLTVLLDLQNCADVTVNLANLAPLLLALGLAYDSDAGRAMAASLAALVTAECYAASAEMAALRGVSAAFTENREAVMRSLRNHRRAVYGDGNDYEKLSVSPSALPLKNCPDLALAAEAQRRWDDALEQARAFGLRATQVTDMAPSPVLALLMESATQGLEPMPRLTAMAQDAAGVYRTNLHAVIGEALARLDYPRETLKAAAQHVIGARSLRKAPAINHATLKAKGLSETAIEKIEAYLPCVDRVRLAATPWIIGVEFCRTVLKIAAKTMESPRFDLLRHLGFDEADCTAADLHCYGQGTLRNARILHIRHRALFACGVEISAEARMRMAAAVQSFVSGDTGMIAHLPLQQSVERGAEITLLAWRAGLKSLSFVFDPALAAQPVRKNAGAGRRIKAAVEAHAKPMATVPPGRVRANGKPSGGKSAAVLSVKKTASGKRTAHK